MNFTADSLPDTNDQLALVEGAFKSSSLRTAFGVADSTGLPEQAVVRILEAHPERFQRFPIKLGGTEVFQLRTSGSGLKNH